MKRYLPILILALILALSFGSVASAGPELQGGSIYYVTWGDTVTGIALRHGVTVQALMRANGLHDPEMIYVGQPLMIPNGGYSGGSRPYDASGCDNYHTVRVGETLSSIAWDYNTSLQALLSTNNLYNKDVLFVGQRICVPASYSSHNSQGYAPQNASFRRPNRSTTSYYHTVTGGETLSSIAFRYGVSQWDIVQANNLNSASFIWAGQELIIPGFHPQPQYNPAPKHDYQSDHSYGNQPPSSPGYHGAYDDVNDDAYDKPPYEDDDDDDGHHKYDSDDDGNVPDAPDYESNPVHPLLPRAEHPIEVVVNGGMNWVGTAYPDTWSADGVTTLVINTGENLDLDSGDGPTIRIRSGDTEAKGFFGLVPEFGVDKLRFAFKYITPGDYDVWIDDPDMPSEVVKVHIQEGARVEIEFRKGLSALDPTFASPDGWYLANWENTSRPGEIIGGWSNILVRTPASGLWVILEAEGGFKAKCFTGTKGPGACDFAGLTAGMYYIHIDGTYLTIKTYLDGNAYATFDLAHQPEG